MDKVLLDTPEDEIDFQRVPIKDLILLAEHKERLTVQYCPFCFLPFLVFLNQLMVI